MYTHLGNYKLHTTKIKTKIAIIDHIFKKKSKIHYNTNDQQLTF